MTLFVSRPKNPRAQITIDSKSGPCHQSVENRSNSRNKAFLLGLHKKAQDPDHFQVEAYGDLPSTMLICQQKISSNGYSQSDGFRFTSIQLPLENADHLRVRDGTHADPVSRADLGSSRLLRGSSEHFFGHISRDQNLSIELVKQIEPAYGREGNEWRGVADDDHSRRRRRSVSRSCSKSSIP